MNSIAAFDALVAVVEQRPRVRRRDRQRLAAERRQRRDAEVHLGVDEVGQLPRPRDDHADLAVVEQLVGLVGVGLGVDVDRAVLGEAVDDGERLLAGLPAEADLAVLGDDVPARLPHGRPDAPHGVLVADRGHAVPNVPFDLSVSCFDVAANSLPRPAAGGRLGHAHLLEQLLVVDHREVVDQRRQRPHLPVDRGRRLGRRVVVVPVEVGLLHVVGEVEHLVGACQVREVRAEDVGDVGVLARRERGRDLLAHLVGDDAAGRRLDLDVRVRRLNSSASSPSTLPAMSSWPCHIVISAGPPDCFASSSPPPSAARERQHGGGGERREGVEAGHCGTSMVERTTERVRLRGRSGSSPAASASATPVRWASTSEASGSSAGATASAPAARTPRAGRRRAPRRTRRPRPGRRC